VLASCSPDGDGPGGSMLFTAAFLDHTLGMCCGENFLNNPMNNERDEAVFALHMVCSHKVC
jgi:hypothetical protein